MNIDKRKEGGQHKMKDWVNELKVLLRDAPLELIILTDIDLIHIVNSRLQPHQRVTKTTFINWKNGKYHQTLELGKEFNDTITIYNIRLKQYIGNEMLNSTSNTWKRYAWILERKFSEWNLKKINIKNTIRNEITLNINTTNENGTN